MKNENIPYKIYLNESEMPKAWYNLRADMKQRPKPVNGGTALSMACSYFDLDCKVYMVKCSYEQKPFRREVMRTYGASVTPSPSMETEVGRKILAKHPGTTGSLGCAISEAVEKAVTSDGGSPSLHI